MNLHANPLLCANLSTFFTRLSTKDGEEFRHEFASLELAQLLNLTVFVASHRMA